MSLGSQRIAFLTDAAFCGDRLFAEGSRDGALNPFRLLQARLAEQGRVLHTADMYERSNSVPDLIVCTNIPAEPLNGTLPTGWASRPRFALLLESEVISSANWQRELQDQFTRLFTWRDSLVDDERFFKLNLPNTIEGARRELRTPDRFCTLIAGNKLSSHPLELYSKRRDAIRWFERFHPEAFDLYGTDWDLPMVGFPRPFGALNIVLPRAARRLLEPRFSSYKGRVETKGDVLRRYRFTICYENTRGVEGYITEKLFDCLLAGTIPIYWGAPDIADHVPATCFIDSCEFASYADLYEHLSTLSDVDCERLRDSGQAFLDSELARPFGTEAWVDTLLAHL
jgi:hypothetical protein